MDTKWVCQRLRALGMTQSFLASKMGLSTGGLNHKLHNRRATTLQEAACMAQWLRMSNQELRNYFFTK